MKVKEEIKEEIKRDVKAAEDKLFRGVVLTSLQRRNILTSLLSGHHIVLIGPPGTGKTSLALNITSLLSEKDVIKNCPVRSYPDDVGCLWCEGMKEREITTLKQYDRIIRVQGSPELVPEDIIGGIDPERALKYGTLSLEAFLPGKLLRANHGVLILDFLDRMPERVLNTILQALDSNKITTRNFDEPIPLDVLIIATASENAIQILPSDMLVYFDVIRMGYIEDKEEEKEVIREKSVFNSQIDITNTLDSLVEIIKETRKHSEIKKGVSTRGAINFAELLNVYPIIYENRNEIERGDIQEAAVVSLPHRIKLQEYASSKSPEEIVIEIVKEVLGEEEKRRITLSREDVLSIATEIAKKDGIKRPLKYGFYDMLLKRIKKYSESKIGKFYEGIYKEIEEIYEKKEREELSEELLDKIEEERKLRERMSRLVKEIEADALDTTLEALEDIGVIEKSKEGFVMGKKGIILLLESLFPKITLSSSLYGYGKHTTGKKSVFGEGRIVGMRKYRLGDRYKDVSFKDTLKEAIRNRRREIKREDIRVNKKDIRTKLYTVLAIDLSGTMAELEKLWYAKEAAGALALSSFTYKDSVGIVSFSNLADEVISLIENPHKVMKAVVDLDLHENAFTNIGYGIRKAREMLLRYKKSSISRHIIVISDGDATAPDPSPEKFAIREAKKTVRKGITISTVCISQASSNPDLMRRIAKIGRGNMMLVGEEERLAEAVLEDRYKMRGKG